jgi:CO/xanthine dehydrogenase FAD-binding subunit
VTRSPLSNIGVLIMQTVVGYHRPESLEEALSLLERGSPRSVLLAGGTSLNALPPGQEVEMIDLQAIGYNQIRPDGTRLEIGAMTRLADVAVHPAVPEVLRDLTRREGPNTLRNAATVGGTIATGNPESELIAGLLVHEAKVNLAKTGGATVTLDLNEVLADRSLFYASILVSVVIQAEGVAAAARTGRTPFDTSIVAAVGRRTGNGLLLALTGVADTPILVDPHSVGDVDPPGDFRGSPAYRRHLAATLTTRVLEELGDRI